MFLSISSQFVGCLAIEIGTEHHRAKALKLVGEAVPRLARSKAVIVAANLLAAEERAFNLDVAEAVTHLAALGA